MRDLQGKKKTNNKQKNKHQTHSWHPIGVKSKELTSNLPICSR